MEVEDENEGERTQEPKEAFELRGYQAFILAKAKTQNVLVCLPTGSGKTFIAVELIKHYLPNAVEKKKKIIFIASTVPLVHQQGNYLDKHLPLKTSSSGSSVRIITGDMQPQLWKETEWRTVVKEYHVFAMIDQILLEALMGGYILWKDIALVVIDECHNATKGHPMANMMADHGKYLAKAKPNDPPRILGLTATIFKGNPKKSDFQGQISECVNNMEKLFQAKAITFPDFDQVSKFSTSATPVLSTYPKYEIDSFELKRMSDIIENKIVSLKEMSTKMKITSVNDAISGLKNVDFYNQKKHPLIKLSSKIREILEVLQELGPVCAKYAARIQLRVLKRNLYREEQTRLEHKEEICQIISDLIKMVSSFIESLENYVKTDHVTDLAEKNGRITFVSPKLNNFLEILLLNRGSIGNEFCGLTFCEKRITAQVLCWYLHDLSNNREGYEFLKCYFVLGLNQAPTMNSQVLANSIGKQLEILSSFRAGKLNLLVCTSVLEEGLDVASCNFVFRFNRIQTYPSYIQSMGRARKPNAKFYALIEEKNYPDEYKKLVRYGELSRAIVKYLNDKVDHPERFIGDKDSIMDTELNKLIPPFQPTDGPQKIIAGSAVQRVYRYCQTLASDKLSKLLPVPWSTSTPPYFQASVQLPISSVIKNVVEGKIFTNRYVAKKSAFMEVCKQMWEAGVLNPKTLMPFPRYELVNFKCKFLEDLEAELELTQTKGKKDDKKVGSKNRLEWYAKKIPQVFETFLKCVPNEPIRVYAIVLTLEYYAGNDELKELYDFDNRSYSYGIITNIDLTEVPEFHLISRGIYNVHLKDVTSTMIGFNAEINSLILTVEQFKVLKSFQDSMFSEVLALNHSVLRTASENSHLIVPLQKQISNGSSKLEIAWSVTENFIQNKVADYTKEIQMLERNSIGFETKKFEDSVVVPFHNKEMKPDNPWMYCVVSILSNQSPMSPFEDLTKAKTYEEYFLNVYDTKIVHKSQPLLLVKAIGKGLNHLKNAKNLSKEERTLQQGRPIKLVPELVRNYPLPASLFMQLKLLPSVLHRIQRLLLAQEIRSSVFKKFDWKPKEISDRIVDEKKMNMIDIEETWLIEKEDGEVLSEENSKQDDDKNHSISTNSTIPTQIGPGSSLKRKLVLQIADLSPNKHFKKIQSSSLIFNDLDDVASISSSTFDEEDEEFCNGEERETLSLLTTTNKPKLASVSLGPAPFQNFDNKTNFEEIGGPSAFQVMEAMTLINGNDMVNLERLEMIGDSVLKLVVTTHIFNHFLEIHEGHMTALRIKLISNKHLFQHGQKKNLGSYLAGSLFLPSESCWLPPNVKVPAIFTEVALKNKVNYSVYLPLKNKNGEVENIKWDELNPEEIELVVERRLGENKNEINKVDRANHTSYTHSRLGDKNIADCVEALIGAYYVNGGIDSALRFMDWFGLKGPTKDPNVSIPYKALRDLPNAIPDYPDEKQKFIALVDTIEDVLGYKFNNQWLLVEAFTHPTYPSNRSTSAYQRLEFLGDAVLDFLITHYIYNTNTKKAKSPGDLTDLRSALVNNITFGSLIVHYGLHKFLLSFSPELNDSIDNFVSYQDRNGHVINGEYIELIGDTDCIVAQDIDVPKALGDLFESLIGAVFLDCGMKLDIAWTVIYRLMKKEIDAFSEDVPKSPVRKLYERFPDMIKFLPEEKVPSEDSDNDLSLSQTMSLKIPQYGNFRGRGKNKASARQAAAKYALRYLRENDIM